MESGAFTPAPEPPPGADRFVVTQPPPNVTGALHLGHALTATVEDAFVRYHRMRGDDTLWLPGVDHASIAAQFVLDRIIAEEGESRASLGRERYLERMWQFMDETRDVIGEQHRRLGASLDWTRLRFTMDDFSARAVRVAFKRLWDAGLVYRGEALVNWCPRCRTTISDLENIHREETGTLWTVRYHLAREDGTPDPDRWISVATTRPETILGDTAVAVHPDDDRYRDLVGREAILPFVGRRLPIVADPSVEREFGTGAVKITPAHDFDDYELGRRHGLPMISVLDEAARMNENGGEFAGLDRFEARAAIVERLREMGDLEGERPHEMVIGHCEKCDTVVEPRLSVQWFIRTKPLAERALASVTEGRTRIIPAHFEKVYAHWMENIHDWAVGRQLWWGHRIPAWFCPDGHITVSDAEGGPDACAECGRAGVGAHPGDRHLRHLVQLRAVAVQHARLARRDPRSPALLPDQRHGDRVRDPLLLGRADDDARPLPDRCRAVPHGLPARDRPRPDRREDEQDEGQRRRPARDDRHDRRGCAPLRPRLRQRARASTSASPKRSSPAAGTSRTSCGTPLASSWEHGPEPMAEPGSDATLAARWIGSRLAAATERATRQLDDLDLAGYAATVYEAAWSDYCDWFLEMAKVDLRRDDATDADRAATWLAAADGLATLLRLLHPLMPFVTEEIWQALADVEPRATAGEPLLIRAAWPTGRRVRPGCGGSLRGPLPLVRMPTRRMRTGPPRGSRRPTGSPRSCGSSIPSCRS